MGHSTLFPVRSANEFVPIKDWGTQQLVLFLAIREIEVGRLNLQSPLFIIVFYEIRETILIYGCVVPIDLLLLYLQVY